MLKKSKEQSNTYHSHEAIIKDVLCNVKRLFEENHKLLQHHSEGSKNLEKPASINPAFSFLSPVQRNASISSARAKKAVSLGSTFLQILYASCLLVKDILSSFIREIREKSLVSISIITSSLMDERREIFLCA